MRKIIAALQTSVDGFIEGPNGELDWAMAEDEEVWRDLYETLRSVDTFILGRGMYPAYEQYWLALLAKPTGTKNENAYARLADKIPHFVLSKTLDKVAWKTTRIVRDVEEIRKMKQQSGKDMLTFGGATLVSSLMNLGLIDELRLMVNPLILGGGKALFKDVKEKHVLNFIRAKPLKSGKIGLIYSTRS
ncbi:MAG TPA: dihydrofolate reductase family protein [Nitrososphaeraceae archaeon]|jgi:dihydrofolate reductase|nr:dihydrofolate reductase family protein [Nitrososphaeraceae archaeon]